MVSDGLHVDRGLKDTEVDVVLVDNENGAFMAVDYWANSLNSPLTAVKLPAIEIGKRAGEFLIQRINDPERPAILMILKSELMKRSSGQVAIYIIYNDL